MTIARIQVRRDTAANWTSANPTLSSGELGYETDTGKFKIGNGATAWASLAYASILPSGGTFTGDISVPDEVYGAGWNGSLEVPTKNAVYDKIETLGSGAVATDAIWDAKGDLAIGTGANTASRLAAGTDGHVLTLDSAQATGVKWAAAAAPTRRGCRVYKNSTTSIATGGLTALTNFDAERFDTDAYHDLVTNPGRITIPSGLGGTYLIGAHMEWAANATGVRSAYIRLNGATYIATVRFNAATGGATTGLSLSTIYTLAATDYLEVVVYQDSGGNLNLNASSQFEQEFFALLVAGS